MSAIIDPKPDSFSLCKGQPSPPPLSNNEYFGSQYIWPGINQQQRIYNLRILSEYFEHIENWFLRHACLHNDSISSYFSSDEKRRAFVKVSRVEIETDGSDKFCCLPLYKSGLPRILLLSGLHQILSRTKFLIDQFLSVSRDKDSVKS